LAAARSHHRVWICAGCILVCLVIAMVFIGMLRPELFGPVFLKRVEENLPGAGRVSHQVLRWSGGVWHGEWIAYFDDGTPREQGHYDRRLGRVGRWYWWHPNGKLARVGCFSAGKNVGVWEFFDQGGVLLERRNYIYGVAFKYDIEYAVDGKLGTYVMPGY